MQDIQELAKRFRGCSDDERFELLLKLRRQEESLRVLNDFAVSLIQISTVDDLAWYVAQEVVGRLGFVDCVFYTYDPKRKILVQRAAIGEKNPEGRTILNPLKIPLGRGITGKVAVSGKPVIVGDVTAAEDYLADINAARSEICVPLLQGENVLGVIDCEDPRAFHFTEAHLETLQAVAAMASSKLIECRVLRQVRGQAQILERVREAVIVTDADGVLTECNEGASTVYGYRRDQLIGMPIASLMADRDDWRRLRPVMLQSVADEGQWRGLIEIKRGDGGQSTVDASLTELTNENGKRIAIIGVGRDVTDLLRAEKAILEKNEALERKQIELEKALQEGETARRANRAKDAFLANTSHELRTPLAGVIGMIGLLEESGLTERQHELVETANVSAHALLTVIDDILDLAKMEAGTLSLRESVFDPVDLVSRAADTMRPAAEAKGLSFSVSVPQKPSWFVLGDAGRIRQILFNLVGNAIKFTDEVRVSVQLELDQDARNSKFTLTVTDTGPGFSASDYGKIFGRFEQLDVSASKSVGGTGLGLAISRELATLMAGTLDASAEPGKGASFRLDVVLGSVPLPRIALAARVIDADNDGIPKKLTVLIAEDNAINQLLVVKILEKFGWTLKLAMNGRQALELLEGDDEFDIILMDIRMPEMDGIEATRQIRQRTDRYGQIPIVALTANTMENDKQAYLEVGMNSVVGKPINRSLLLTAITSALAATS